MKIGLDIDGVLCKFVEGVLEYMNQKYGTSWKPEDIVEYGLAPKYFTEEQVRALWDDIYKYNLWEKFGVYEEAEEFVKWLYDEGHSSTVLTLRYNTEQCVMSTHNWFEQHQLEYDQMFFNCRKGDACAELGIKLFIEDSIEVAKEIADKGILTLLWDRPYNRNFIYPNVIRVYSWEQVKTIISSMERLKGDKNE